MKTFIVLGTGCAKCAKTAEVIEKVAAELGSEVSVSKETSPQTIMSYGVMSTPAIVADGAVVHSGSIPSRDQVQRWLET